MNEKEKALEALNVVCAGVKLENGTLQTDILILNYHVRRAIDRCFRLGISLVEVNKILKKYV